MVKVKKAKAKREEAPDIVPLYEVECIVGKRLKRNKIEYLVKWKGFGVRYCSWEDDVNISTNASDAVEKYHKFREDHPEILENAKGEWHMPEEHWRRVLGMPLRIISDSKEEDMEHESTPNSEKTNSTEEEDLAKNTDADASTPVVNDTFGPVEIIGIVKIKDRDSYRVQVKVIETGKMLYLQQKDFHRIEYQLIVWILNNAL